MDSDRAALAAISMMCSTLLGAVLIIAHYCYVGLELGGSCTR